MSIMRTNGMGTISTNIVFNQLLTIRDYNKDIDLGVFWGWDMKTAIEHDSFYSFEFRNRADARFVYVLLHRKPIVLDKNQMQYECYVADMNDRWKCTNYFTINQLENNTFYDNIEGIIENMYINL